MSYNMEEFCAKKVLVVDDFKSMRSILGKMLAQLGFTDICDAPGGEEALAQLRQDNYDLVIADWNMHPMTGYELLKEIRNDNKLLSVPVVLMTAEDTEDKANLAKVAGAADFLVKPFAADVLGEKAREAMERNLDQETFGEEENDGNVDVETSVFAGASVLVVDDFKSMRSILSRMFTNLGFKKIVEASSGPEALEKLKRRRFELVIADWNMAPMTGIELLHKVKGDASMSQTPVILITAEDKSEQFDMAKKSGAADFLTKPFGLEVLQQAAHDAMFGEQEEEVWHV